MRSSFLTHATLGTVLTVTLTVAACGGDKGTTADSATTSSAAPAAPAAATSSATSSATSGTAQEPDAGRTVIIVNMVSDEKGNYFEPADFEAHKGDVIRYTLKAGVHNVHFLADSNAKVSGYPATPGDFLQLPGQTFDVKVTWNEGTYFFQCDPHAALGMKGRVKVED